MAQELPYAMSAVLKRKKIHAPHSFTIAKTWKQPKCPSQMSGLRKCGYIYTMEYYPAITKNKIMSFASTWMELEILILN